MLAGEATTVYKFVSEKVWKCVVQHRHKNGQLQGARCFRYDGLLKKLGLQVLASTGI